MTTPSRLYVAAVYERDRKDVYVMQACDHTPDRLVAVYRRTLNGEWVRA